jgi:hypothetical protein
MRVVALIPENDAQAVQVRNALKISVPAENLQVFSSTSAIVDSAKLPLDGATILVVYVDEQQTLSHLASIRGLLSEVQVVLVLPTDEKAVVAIGHSLRPRVVLYIDHVATQLAPILARMQNRLEPAI